MRAFLPLFLIAGFATAGDKDDAKDKEQLQGLWQAVSLETSGEKAPEEVVKMFQV